MVIIDGAEFLTEEEKRLKEDRERTKYWKKWGPYVAERQWATGTFVQHSCYKSILILSSQRGLLVSYVPLILITDMLTSCSHDGDAWSRKPAARSVVLSITNGEL